jgi:hypothetical protein
MEWIQANWVNIMAIYGALVAVATAVVKITPSTRDDEILGKVIRFLDFFSTVNVKKA